MYSETQVQPDAVMRGLFGVSRKGHWRVLRANAESDDRQIILHALKSKASRTPLTGWPDS
jgi:hypothetical protein